jgi:hypothetical protein
MDISLVHSSMSEQSYDCEQCHVHCQANKSSKRRSERLPIQLPVLDCLSAFTTQYLLRSIFANIPYKATRDPPMSHALDFLLDDETRGE